METWQIFSPLYLVHSHLEINKDGYEILQEL